MLIVIIPLSQAQPTVSSSSALQTLSPRLLSHARAQRNLVVGMRARLFAFFASEARFVCCCMRCDFVSCLRVLVGAMASVHLSGPQVASAAVAKPSSLDGLRVPPSLAVSRGRRFRGLVARAATVVSPKVTRLLSIYAVYGIGIFWLQGAFGCLRLVWWS